jgi:hypothetical protein
MIILTISLARVILAASIGASDMVVVELDLSIQLLTRPQPKASANSNTEAGNAGLNLPGNILRSLRARRGGFTMEDA